MNEVQIVLVMAMAAIASIFVPSRITAILLNGVLGIQLLCFLSYSVRLI